MAFVKKTIKDRLNPRPGEYIEQTMEDGAVKHTPAAQDTQEGTDLDAEHMQRYEDALEDHENRIGTQENETAKLSDYINKLDGTASIPELISQDKPTASLEPNNTDAPLVITGTGRRVTNLIGDIGGFKYESYEAGKAIGWTADYLQGAVASLSGGVQTITSTADDTSQERHVGTGGSDIRMGDNKYYLYSAYVSGDSGAIADLRAYPYTGGGAVNTGDFSAPTIPRRYGVIFYTDVDPLGYLRLYNRSALGTELAVHFQKASLHEITETEYSSLSVGELLEMYPYKEGTQSLAGLAWDIRNENLFSLDKYKITTGVSRPVETETGFKVTFTETLRPLDILIENLIVGDEYTIDYTEAKNIEVREVTDGVVGPVTRYGKGTFTATTNAISFRVFEGATVPITAEFTNVTITHGSTAPAEYIKPYHQLVISKANEHFSENDKYKIADGKMRVKRKVSNPVVLDGTRNGEFDFQYYADRVGFKIFSAVIDPNLFDKGVQNVTRPDGRPLKRYTVATMTENGFDEAGRRLFWSIPDTYSGFGESYTPTQEETLACINGWVMYYWNGSAHELYNNQNGDGTGKRWAKRYQGIGNAPVTLTFGALVEDGTYTLDFCPKEKAYGDITKFYTLQYEFEQEQLYDVDLWGIPSLPEGKSYVTQLSGVFTESIKAKMYESGGVMVANNKLEWSSKLNHDAKRIIDIFGYDENGTRIDLRDSCTWGTAVDGLASANWFGVYITDFPIDLYNSLSQIFVTLEAYPETSDAGIFTAEATVKDDIQTVAESQGKRIAYLDNQLAVAQAQITEMSDTEEYEPTLLNGFTVDGTNDVIIKRVGNKTSIRGAITSLTNAEIVLKTFFRPDRLLVFDCATNSPSYSAQINLNNVGEARLFYEAGATTVWLDIEYEL